MKKNSSGNATIQPYVPTLTGTLLQGRLSIPVVVTHTKRAFGRQLYRVRVVPGLGRGVWVASGLSIDPIVRRP